MMKGSCQFITFSSKYLKIIKRYTTIIDKEINYTFVGSASKDVELSFFYIGTKLSILFHLYKDNDFLKFI